MKTAQKIQKNELSGAEWNALVQTINSPRISVSVNNGFVILSGSVESYRKKMLAEQAVAGIAGVKSILNSLEVNTTEKDRKKDDELTEAILSVLNSEIDSQESSFTNPAKHSKKTLHHSMPRPLNDFRYWEIFC